MENQEHAFSPLFMWVSTIYVIILERVAKTPRIAGWANMPEIATDGKSWNPESQGKKGLPLPSPESWISLDWSKQNAELPLDHEAVAIGEQAALCMSFQKSTGTRRVISIPITSSHHLTSSFLWWSCYVTPPLLHYVLPSPQEVDDPKLKLMCFSILGWKCTAGSNPGPTEMHVLCSSQSPFLSLRKQPDRSTAFSRRLHVYTSTHTYLCLWELGSSFLFYLKTFFNILFQKHQNKNKREENILLGVYRKVREWDWNGSSDVLH